MERWRRRTYWTTLTGKFVYLIYRKNLQICCLDDLCLSTSLTPYWCLSSSSFTTYIHAVMGLPLSSIEHSLKIIAFSVNNEWGTYTILNKTVCTKLVYKSSLGRGRAGGKVVSVLIPTIRVRIPLQSVKIVEMKEKTKRGQDWLIFSK